MEYINLRAILKHKYKFFGQYYVMGKVKECTLGGLLLAFFDKAMFS